MTGFEFAEELAGLQDSYRNLVNSGNVTKRKIIDLVVPFRDKYNLSDSDALCIARNECSLSKCVELCKKGIGLL